MLLGMTAAALGVGWLSGGYLKSAEAPPRRRSGAGKQRHGGE